MFYKEHIQIHLEEALKKEGKAKSNIRLIQQVTKEWWELEDPEIKQQVKDKLAEKSALRESKGPHMPEQYQRLAICRLLLS